MTKILNTIILIHPTLNYDTSLIIYFYVIKDKIENLIDNRYNDFPFNLNCSLNKLYCYIYQINIYKLNSYDSKWSCNLKRFVKCYLSMYSIYDIDILNIYEKNGLFKIKSIYNLLI